MNLPKKQKEEKGFFYFTRADIAIWYGITMSGLRTRMRKVHLIIKNRILTIEDIKAIFMQVGRSQHCPPEIWALCFGN